MLSFLGFRVGGLRVGAARVSAAVGALALVGCFGGDDGGDPDRNGPAAAGTANGGSSSTSGAGGDAPQGDPGGAGAVGGSAGSSGSGDAPVALPGKGVGQPCETSADCESGLTCNVDSTDYIVHKQCTASCTSEEACTGEFGEDTMCIGAELCTLECRTDADCPDKTLCNEFGWCARSGAGSGVPYCTGSATPCSLLEGTECLLTLGCQDDSECSGSAVSCFAQFSSYSCNAQDGCYWLSDSCSGVASSCSSQYSETSCTFQEGCYWSSACTGTPYECEDLTPALCTSQPGCVLME